MAEVAGIDVVQDPSAVRARIGLVFQDPSLDGQLTGRENLEFHAYLYGLPAATRKQRIDDALAIVDLTERAGSTVLTYSGGMRRRLEIARGILHYPQVLFLDEPTLGLDPQTRNKIWDYLHAVRTREHITIFMTTHYMDEAEFCDRIAIIDQGKIVALGTPAELKSEGRRRRRHDHHARTGRGGGADRGVMHLESTQVDGTLRVEVDGLRVVHAASVLGADRADHRGERAAAEPRRRVPQAHRSRDPRAGEQVARYHAEHGQDVGRRAAMSDQVLLTYQRSARSARSTSAARRCARSTSSGSAISSAIGATACVCSRRSRSRCCFSSCSAAVSARRCAARGGFGGPGSSLQYVQFIFPGIIGMSVLFTSIFGAMSIVWDREFGFLKEVLVAPIHRSAVAIGKTLGGATQAMIQGLVILVLAPLVGVKLTVVGVVELVPLIFVFAFALSALGVAVAARMRTMQGFQVVMNFLMMPMFFLAGALFPLGGNLPAWLLVLTRLDPASYGIDALRRTRAQRCRACRLAFSTASASPSSGRRSPSGPRRRCWLRSGCDAGLAVYGFRQRD